MDFIWNFSIGFNPLTRLLRRFGGINRVIASNALLGFRRDAGAMPVSSKRTVGKSRQPLAPTSLVHSNKEAVALYFSCWFLRVSKNQLLCKGDLLFCPPFVGIKPD